MCVYGTALACRLKIRTLDELCVALAITSIHLKTKSKPTMSIDKQKNVKKKSFSLMVGNLWKINLRLDSFKRESNWTERKTPSLAIGICECHQLSYFYTNLHALINRKLFSGEVRKLLFGVVKRELNSRHYRHSAFFFFLLWGLDFWTWLKYADVSGIKLSFFCSL